MHAIFEELTRVFFSLLVCGSLVDPDTGLTFSFGANKTWKFIIEIPHINTDGIAIRDNHAKILPILSILSPSTIDEVTDENYPLFIGEEEELVARFLKAYETSTIDRMLTYDIDGDEQPVIFERLTDPEECRRYINDCANTHAKELSDNKVLLISFIKFLHRRFLFFNSSFYKMNEEHECLGSSIIKQMIDEAKSLATINFQTSSYPRIFLAYDPYFALHLLHDGWPRVSSDLQKIFKHSDPLLGKEFTNRNHYAKCLSWLIDIKYKDFEQIMKDKKFILTENFAYKIFHVHERKLTKLPLIIEGETGVGKTFLLNFYSSLLNSKIANESLENETAPRIVDRTSQWLLTTILTEIIEKDSNLLNKCLRRLKVKLTQDGKKETANYHSDEHDDSDEHESEDNLTTSLHVNQPDDDNNHQENTTSHLINENAQSMDDVDRERSTSTLSVIFEERPSTIPHRVKVIDVEFLLEMERSLQIFKYDKNNLQQIWSVFLTVSAQCSDVIKQKLIKELYRYVTSSLTKFPLIEASFRLKTLLAEKSIPGVQTCIKIFNEYVSSTQMKPLFYRLLLHPGVTEEQLEEFLSPIAQLARQLPKIELVVFFDEINTSSCLGLFKEIFIDRTLHGSDLPRNIFFTGAINPARKIENNNVRVHRIDYVVHELPAALENLKVSYGILGSKILKDYITKKIAMFEVESQKDSGQKMPLDGYSQKVLSRSILCAQEFCEENLGILHNLSFTENSCFMFLGENTVSQREVQRCFTLIDFFWNLRYDEDLEYEACQYQPNPITCIALSLALTYYFRLPSKEDNLQRQDTTTPSREQLGELLSEYVPDFIQTVQEELIKFVNADNFVIPQGVAINQAVCAYICCFTKKISSSFFNQDSRTYLCNCRKCCHSNTLVYHWRTRLVYFYFFHICIANP